MNKENIQSKPDSRKIEDKFFKECIPGINRLLKKLEINHTIVEIIPNEFLNDNDKTKTMDLGGLIEECPINEEEDKKILLGGLKNENNCPINLEFKANYPSREEIENTLEYSFHLASKYGKPVYSYIISTKNHEENEYRVKWHNNDVYCIPLKTLKKFDAEETRLKIQNKLDRNEDITDDDLTDISVLTFMDSDKDPKELLIISSNLITQINEDNSVGITMDDINGVKNLLRLLALKFTDTQEEYEEIERMMQMNGGMLQGTVEQLKLIGRIEGKEEGIKEGRKETEKEWYEDKIETAKYLLSIKIPIKDVSKATKLDEEEIRKIDENI